MKALTKEGQQHIDDIAAEYSLKTETVESLLKAVINGNGTMAQFNIPELGGAGQWMKGGMTMIGDMFNSTLKTKVEKLCSDLSHLVSSKVLFEESAGASEDRAVSNGSSFGRAGNSWPTVFGSPTSSGSQNNLKYAYFGPVRRLVIEEDGKRTIYDTKHHQITGIAQQQGAGSSYQFTSQEGAVDLGSLSVISEPGADRSQPLPEIAYDVTSTADLRTGENAASPQDIIISTIEKINILFEKGQISEEEFKAKKQELLARL